MKSPHIPAEHIINLPSRFVRPYLRLSMCQAGLEALDVLETVNERDMVAFAALVAAQDYFRPVVVRTVVTLTGLRPMLDALGVGPTHALLARFFPISFKQEIRYANALAL